MSSPSESLALLRTSDVFGALDRPALEAIAGLAMRKDYTPGQVVFFQHDPPDALYVMISGEVRVTASSDDGREIVLNRMYAGEMFGEIALIDGQPRTATITAATPSTMLRIPRSSFLALLERQPRIAMQLLVVLCKRLRFTTTRVEEDSFLPVAARLARRLLALSKLHGVEGGDGVTIDQHLPQATLASMLGVSRQTVNKHLMLWKRQGVIEVRRARVTVVDQWALEEIAEQFE